jgi:hypothetical protein
MILCPKCGLENTPDSIFCRRCGTRLLPMEGAETTLAYAAGDREDTGAHARERGPAVSGTVLIIRTVGDREGEVVCMEGDSFTIGRSPQSDLFLDDVTVSRHHARIVVDEEDGFFVEDLNSLNGTYVNRKRIERHQLFDGDELQVGKFKLDFLHRNEEC